MNAKLDTKKCKEITAGHYTFSPFTSKRQADKETTSTNQSKESLLGYFFIAL
jgi:hypothetical protein